MQLKLAQYSPTVNQFQIVQLMLRPMLDNKGKLNAIPPRGGMASTILVDEDA